MSWDGSGLGVDADDGKFEPLTIIGGVIGVEDRHIFQTVDSRYPTNTSGRKIADTISALAGELAEIELKRDTAPFYMSIDNPAVKVCMDVYNAVTGEDAKPYTMGGGTYGARFPERRVLRSGASGAQLSRLLRPDTRRGRGGKALTSSWRH